MILGVPQTWNRYAYVANGPLNSVDPLGLFRSWDQYDKGGFDNSCSINGMAANCGMASALLAEGGGGAAAVDCGSNCDPFISGALRIGGGGQIVTPNGDLFYLSGDRPASLSDFGLVASANNVNKHYGLTTPCGSSASQVMGAVEGNFAQFGNYSRWGGLESVTFSPPSGMGSGSTIPISVSVFGFTQSLSVNVQSMNSQSMTFTTNPGHLLYPASITFASSPASPGSINFNINLGGTVASPAQFYLGGSSFEHAQWNHFLGKVGGFCKVGG